MPHLVETQPTGEVLPRPQAIQPRSVRFWNASFRQFARFSVVGILNTLIDVTMLNMLLWRYPTHSAKLLLVYNSCAYCLGALNSFCLNKYWTFKQRYALTGGEIVRFAVVSITGILCSDSILWLVARFLHPLIINNLLWANISKGIAIVGTMTLSYLGMRLWVFTKGAGQEEIKLASSLPHLADQTGGHIPPVADGRAETMEQAQAEANADRKLPYSLSVILPAYNEEIIIAQTVRGIVDTLARWGLDFEVIVVNDGSKDRTRAIVEEIAAADSRVELINHAVNQGYGGALTSGFKATTKDLVFFMDSDGQFDMDDLERFFPFIGKYDAVLGYRLDRQDTLVRKLNAWGWKMLVRLVFGLQVRDIDCAFKLYPARFFHEELLETRGAMINTEILYKVTRADYTYTEVGVRHLPRKGGRATGANPIVIARAFVELFVYARKWHREEQKTVSR